MVFPGRYPGHGPGHAGPGRVLDLQTALVAMGLTQPGQSAIGLSAIITARENLECRAARDPHPVWTPVLLIAKWQPPTLRRRLIPAANEQRARMPNPPQAARRCVHQARCVLDQGQTRTLPPPGHGGDPIFDPQIQVGQDRRQRWRNRPTFSGPQPTACLVHQRQIIVDATRPASCHAARHRCNPQTIFGVTRWTFSQARLGHGRGLRRARQPLLDPRRNLSSTSSCR